MTNSFFDRPTRAEFQGWICTGNDRLHLLPDLFHFLQHLVVGLGERANFTAGFIPLLRNVLNRFLRRLQARSEFIQIALQVLEALVFSFFRNHRNKRRRVQEFDQRLLFHKSEGEKLWDWW